ncbi:MAG: pyridoxamine 5'-phosphate oxidase family protein [Croceibacterium sp.]
MSKTLADISEAMRDIDFCMLVSRAADGAIAGRPMSNNREVEYEGTSRFFTYDDSHMTHEIDRDPSIGLTYQGKAGLLGVVGKPGMFIHVEGTGRLVKDKAQFAKYWTEGLDRWFEQGVDTPGLTLIEVEANRIHYWDGEDSGEVKLPATAAA